MIKDKLKNSFKNEPKGQNGIAALLTVIMAAGIISIIILPMSLQVYLLRSNTLSTELKNVSRFSAISCLEILMILMNEFEGESVEKINTKTVPDCRILSMRSHGVDYIIELESKNSDFLTKLRATVDIPLQKIISIQEVINL